MKKYIGIFDSGVGGLGIFKEIKRFLPSENILYLADSKNCPYGEKTVEEIKKICKKNTQFLLHNNAKIIVVACNSASVAALNYLRTEFPGVPIVGVVPVVKTAVKLTKNKKIGILATRATVQSEYLKGLVKEFCSGINVYYQASGELVDLIENDINGEKRREVLNNCLKKFIKNDVDVIALGCTHFPFVKKEIQKIVGARTEVLDSSGAVARQVKRVLTQNEELLGSQKNPDYQFYTSGTVSELKKRIKNLIYLETDQVRSI